MKKLFILMVLLIINTTYSVTDSLFDRLSDNKTYCQDYGTPLVDQTGIKKVAIFVNGQGTCCADRMYDVIDYINMSAKIYSIPWDSNGYLLNKNCREASLPQEGVSDPIAFTKHLNGFIDQLDEYIKSLDNNIEIYLFGHSLGANSIMQYLNSAKADPNRLIKYVGIFDAVGLAGFRPEIMSSFINSNQLIVPSQVENFFNVYQKNAPFPFDFSKSGSFKIASKSTISEQLESNFRRNKDGTNVRKKCGFWEICEDGKKRLRLWHQDVPIDSFVQENVITMLKELTPIYLGTINLAYAKSSYEISYISSGQKIDISIVVPPKKGKILFINKNTIKYIPNQPYPSGHDSFILRGKDLQGNFKTKNAEQSISIKSNLPPIAYTNTVETRWNSKTVFDPDDPTGIDRIKNLDVSAGYDPDEHLLSIQVTSAPQHGEISVRGNRLIYTPEDEFKGSDLVKYALVDEFGFKSNGTLSINVVAPVSNLQARPSGTGQGSGTIVSEPGGISAKGYDFPTGTYVTLTAIPDKNSIFREWDGAGCSKFDDDPECKLFMDTAKQVFPIFDLAPASYNLTVNKTGNGKGLVESEMPGISCGDECSADYQYGQNVRVNLHAIPDTNSTFLGWSGDCSGKESCIQYMSADYIVTANFAINNPKNFTVTTLDDNGSGSLRQAIVDSNLNPGKDTIIFATNLKGTITLENGEMKVTDSVSIEGPGAKQIAISGNNNSRIFHLDPGSTQSLVGIAGITIKDGFDKDENGGGAIIINTGDITINEVHFSKNSADNVGGGGAIRKFGQATLTIQNSAFTDCSAFSVDYEGEGGAIRIASGSTSIINTTISGNRAANGGGLSIANDANLTLINSTITNNIASYSGGGLYNTGDSFLGNNIISGNIAPENNEIDSFGVLKSLGHNIFGEKGTAGIAADTNISDSDIIFSDSIQTVIHLLSDNGGETPTHMPVDNGPAINAGNDNLYASSVVTDQRGEVYFRFMGNPIDIGSVEKFAPLVVTDKFSLLVGETIKLPIDQGHPVVANFENIDIAYGYIIPDFGDVFIVGESAGSATLLLGDVQGNVSKILIEVSAVDDNSTETPLSSDDGTNTPLATNTGSGGGGCTYNPNNKDFDMTFLFIVALGLLYPFRRRFLK